ncbi:MAG: hypothetical protein AAFP19_15105 [Bacteroidota bacterium]
MKNYIYLSLIMSLLLLLFNACKSEQVRFTDRLDGEWVIEKSERWIIHQDGSTEQFEDLSDAGRMEVYEPNPPATTFKEFTFTYTNFEGGQANMQSYIFADEDSRRVFMSQVLCNSPFECDIVWTVEENKRKKQIWSTYGTEEGFFYPPDRWDASDDAYHFKWRIVLRRD